MKQNHSERGKECTIFPPTQNHFCVRFCLNLSRFVTPLNNHGRAEVMGKVLRKLLASGIISSWTAGKWFQKAKGYSPRKPEGEAGGRSFCTFAGCKEKGGSGNYLSLWLRCLSCLPERIGLTWENLICHLGSKTGLNVVQSWVLLPGVPPLSGHLGPML